MSDGEYQSKEKYIISVRQEDSDQKAEPISPISKLPFDILSAIFVLCSAEVRLSPIDIASVCRHWRETILMTPIAWSRIFPQNFSQFILPPEYVSMFLERSKPCLLHISIPWASRDCYCAGHQSPDTTMCDCANVATILKHGDRVQCLSVRQDWIGELNKEEYPNLRRLELIKCNSDRHPPRIPLDISRFKNLQSLKLGHLWQADSRMDIFSAPSLRSLYLPIDPDDSWTRLVANFSSSLELLYLQGDFGESATRKWTIRCPRLLTVIIVEGKTPGMKGTRILEIICPQIVAYEYYSVDEIVEVAPSGGVERITILRVNTIIALFPYKLLETLQLDADYDWLGPILCQLEGDYHLCPALKSIEVRDKPDGDHELAFHERIANRNRVAGSHIKLTFVTVWLHHIPTFYHTCSKDMPCRAAYHNNWPGEDKYYS